jgi:hypothetical protein
MPIHGVLQAVAIEPEDDHDQREQRQQGGRSYRERSADGALRPVIQPATVLEGTIERPPCYILRAV